MIIPDLSHFPEITFGPAFHVAPLRGKSFAVTDLSFVGPLQLRITLAPGGSEFNSHLLDYERRDYAAPYLNFTDKAGGLLFTLAPAE